VVKVGTRLTAIEVKAGHAGLKTLPGIEAFVGEYRTNRRLLVGAGGIALEMFLSEPVQHWTE
jgi:hypothetical protein